MMGRVELPKNQTMRQWWVKSEWSSLQHLVKNHPNGPLPRVGIRLQMGLLPSTPGSPGMLGPVHLLLPLPLTREATKALFCYGLSCVSSKFICKSFNTWHLRMWLILELGSLKKQLNWHEVFKVGPKPACLMGMGWYTPVIPALRRWRLEDQEFMVILNYKEFEASLETRG